ncbi:MAG: AAA family ATPase [Kiritimatiellae bacterium]|nr:AAA family ATPase [Kiritimatiellia bacterium]
MLISRMKPISKNNCDFPSLRKSGCLYVDKTAWFYRMATDPQASFFFLARPRRFGKSLMISTLEAMFQGRREFFEGLAIMDTDWDWKKKYPVIHLNMGMCAASDFDTFAQNLPDCMEAALVGAGVKYDKKKTPSANFGKAIDALAAKGKPPVILIDEYDDPVAKALKNPDVAERVRDALSPIYGQMKDRSGKIRFLMITGVSKFTKLSVFSALSSLVDISFDDDYASMLGYTEDELDRYFSEHMEAHRMVMGMTAEAYRAEIRRLYNGYRFWLDDGEKVYNPVSINLTMANRRKRFELYWAETGKASFLMNMLKRGDMLAVDPEKLRNMTRTNLDVSDLRRFPVAGMLYQTGYLTILDYNGTTDRFTLGIPDDEVRQDFSCLMSGLVADRDTAWAFEIGGHLQSAEWPEFFEGLAALYAGAVYGSTEGKPHELSYARCLKFLLQGQGFRVEQEVPHAGGRTDIVADHPCGTYIFELKVNKPPKVAMSQIQRKKYAAPYRTAGKPVWTVGLSFDGKTRQFKGGIAEKLKT